jgi:ABC-type sugar transport system substrate-binding protein
MTKEEAIKVLEQALNAANLKGIFTLNDASAVIQALKKVNELIELIPSED